MIDPSITAYALIIALIGGLLAIAIGLPSEYDDHE
jgi:hypothetical protein